MPMTSTLTMAKADRLRPGTRAYGEHLLRLARIDAVAKARALGGPEDVARVQFENQEERQAGLRPYQESIDASQRAVADIGVQDKAAELAHVQTLARQQSIYETGFADPDSPEARAAAQATVDPAVAGAQAAARWRAAAAALNPERAAAEAAAALPGTTEPTPWQPERVKDTTTKTTIASLMSQGMTYERAREAVAELSAAGQMGGIIPDPNAAMNVTEAQLNARMEGTKRDAAGNLVTLAGEPAKVEPHGPGATWVGRGAVRYEPTLDTKRDVLGNLVPGARAVEIGPDVRTQQRRAETKLRLLEPIVRGQERAAAGRTAIAGAGQAEAQVQQAQATAKIANDLAQIIPTLSSKQKAMLFGVHQADPWTQANTMLAVASQITDPIVQKALIDATFATIGMTPVYEETAEGTIEFLSRQLRRLFSGGRAGQPPQILKRYEPKKASIQGTSAR